MVPSWGRCEANYIKPGKNPSEMNFSKMSTRLWSIHTEPKKKESQFSQHCNYEEVTRSSSPCKRSLTARQGWWYDGTVILFYCVGAEHVLNLPTRTSSSANNSLWPPNCHSGILMSPYQTLQTVEPIPQAAASWSSSSVFRKRWPQPMKPKNLYSSLLSRYISSF